MRFYCASDVSNNDLCGTIPVNGPFGTFSMERYYFYHIPFFDALSDMAPWPIKEVTYWLFIVFLKRDKRSCIKFFSGS